jgi:hypothetical protein
MIFLSVYIGVCTYLMTGKKNQYFYQVMAFVAAIICFDGGANSLNAFETAMVRIQQTGMGIMIYTLVSVFLWFLFSCGRAPPAVSSTKSVATWSRSSAACLKPTDG